MVTAEQMLALFGAGLHLLAHNVSSSCRGPDLTARDYQPDVSPFRVEVAKRITAFNHLTADIAYTELLTGPCLRSDAAGAFPPTIKTAGATGVLATPLAA